MSLLLAASVQVSIVSVTALMISTALTRRAAALRHWVLAASVCCSLCLPVAGLVMPSWPLPRPAFWTSVQSPLALQWATGPQPSTRDTGPRSQPATPAEPVLSRAVVWLWAAGSLLALGSWAAGMYRVRQLASHARVLSTGAWRAVADELERDVGVRPRVRLLLGAHSTMLVTWGLRTPTILLPWSAQAWPEDRLRVVLQHELAHVRRRDWLTACAAHLLRSLHWFNPVVWIVCRQLRLESERACDDQVLASGTSGTDYAAHLLDIARETSGAGRMPAVAMPIAHPSTLERRVLAMLNTRLDRRPTAPLLRLGTAALIATVALSVATARLSGEAPSAPPPPSPASGVSAGGLARPATLVPPAARGPAAAGDQDTPGSQTPTGTIEGVLYDPYGGLLPGVSVMLTGATTGHHRMTLTDRGGAFVFRNLPPDDYQVVTDLVGFARVTNLIRADPAVTVRRHITLPIGTISETIAVTCDSAAPAATRPGAPSASQVPGSTADRPAPGGTEPTLPSTFTGGIGGQIKIPVKVAHVAPACPAASAPRNTVVRLAGRIGIDGLITDLRDVSPEPQGVYAESAMAAARRWAFTPTLLNGAPIEVNISILMDYRWNQR